MKTCEDDHVEASSGGFGRPHRCRNRSGDRRSVAAEKPHVSFARERRGAVASPKGRVQPAVDDTETDVGIHKNKKNTALLQIYIIIY